MYLLDTNVVSELRRPRPHPAVLRWIADVPPDQLYLSVVTRNARDFSELGVELQNPFAG